MKQKDNETEQEEYKSIRAISFLLRGNIPEKYAWSKDKHLQRKILLIVISCHLAAFVQSCGYFIKQTAFPYLTKRLGVNPQVYGFIISFTAVLQLLGGPAIGRIGDLWGGRFTLLLSFVALVVCYFLNSIATNVAMLFISRVPLLVAHALQSTYLIISDVTYQEERANVIGKLGVSHGLGMIAGSGLGGVITDKFGIRAAFIVAMFVVLTCVFITIAMIPANTRAIRETLDESIMIEDVENFNKSEIDKTNRKEEETTSSLKKMLEVLKTKHMVYLLIIKIISGFPFTVLGSMFTLILMDYYKLNPKENGLVLSYLGVVGMVTQGYLVGKLSELYEDATLILVSIILMAAGALFLILSESIYLFCVVCIPLTIGGSLIHIIITSLITKIVDKNETGSALGLTLCTHATIRSVSPTLGGVLLQHIGFYSFGVLAYVINALLAVYLIFFGREKFE